MVPPYFSDIGLPNTLPYGATLLIPDDTPPPDVDGRIITHGLTGEEPFEEQLFGRDYLLKEVAPGRYDWEIDESGTDFKQVGGIANLKQALNTRIVTERRSVPLIPEMGTDDVVGSLGAVQHHLKRVSLLRSIQEDPRILSVPRVDLSGSTGDTLRVRLDVIPYGLVRRESVTIETPI